MLYHGRDIGSGAVQQAAASAARAGKDWTDDGTARQARGLKHRAQHETRSIPIPPVLVQMLRGHLKRYGTAPDADLHQGTVPADRRAAVRCGLQADGHVQTMKEASGGEVISRP